MAGGGQCWGGYGGGESPGRTEVALEWGSQPSTSLPPTEPQGTGWLPGGQEAGAFPQAEGPRNPGRVHPKGVKEESQPAVGDRSRQSRPRKGLPARPQPPWAECLFPPAQRRQCWPGKKPRQVRAGLPPSLKPPP